KSIILVEENVKYKISAKTGGTNGIDKDTPEKALGWYVGFVEKGDNVFYFACNIDGKNFMDIKETRVDITQSVLKDLKITD
ncbi:MAG: penicillin-binding transpeptidase domain-containing protein, partial [Candidatus Pacearchaeota archaeon]|nr:penicillin-binding transpeptidase domain-containing protein [Candidatus Pacearchaeota archaeon]